MKDQVKFIESRMPPTIGHPQNLYEGLLQRQGKRRALYIAEQNGVPGYSTTFWRPDEPLTCLTQEKLYGKRYDMDRLHRFYRYPTENGGLYSLLRRFPRPTKNNSCRDPCACCIGTLVVRATECRRALLRSVIWLVSLTQGPFSFKKFVRFRVFFKVPVRLGNRTIGVNFSNVGRVERT